jgi:hypothetical protein
MNDANIHTVIHPNSLHVHDIINTLHIFRSGGVIAVTIN